MYIFLSLATLMVTLASSIGCVTPRISKHNECIGSRMYEEAISYIEKDSILINRFKIDKKTIPLSVVNRFVFPPLDMEGAASHEEWSLLKDSIQRYHQGDLPLIDSSTFDIFAECDGWYVVNLARTQDVLYSVEFSRPYYYDYINGYFFVAGVFLNTGHYLSASEIMGHASKTIWYGFVYARDGKLIHVFTRD